MQGSKRKGRRPGTWELRVDAGEDPLTRKRQQKSVTFHGTSRQADVALAELITKSARLVEAKAVRIGDSAWAPRFTAVVEPNEFTATVELAKQTSGLLKRLDDFWNLFDDPSSSRPPGSSTADGSKPGTAIASERITWSWRPRARPLADSGPS